VFKWLFEELWAIFINIMCLTHANISLQVHPHLLLILCSLCKRSLIEFFTKKVKRRCALEGYKQMLC
jgi:hypothetical protein